MSSASHNVLDQIFSPRSVALIGVSTRTGPGTYNVLERMIECGFGGRIYPVNPRGGELLGLPVYRSVLDIPEVVDLAVISTPRTAVLDVVKDCVTCGIKAVVIITQGFADADDEGRKMQAALVEAVKDTDTRIVGPNTLGVANLFMNFNTSFVSYLTHKCKTGIICQSGIFLAGSSDFTAGLGLGVDIGNSSDVDFSDSMEYMGHDPRVRVINLHMEGIHNGRRFMETARQVSKSKPILCLKTGHSEAGARAASSHSGSLAGEDHVFEAAFKQCGIIRVNNVEDLYYFNKSFLTYRTITGRRIGIVTISGGAGIAAVDACSAYGLEVAKFDNETMQKLAEVFPNWMDVGNPADIWPAGMARGYHKILELALDTILSDPNVDALLCISPAYTEPAADPLFAGEIINRAAARHPDKPTAVWNFGPCKDESTRLLEEKGIVVAYPSPERAMASLAALNHYYNNIKKSMPEKHPVYTDINKTSALSVITEAISDKTHTLNEQALQILKDYGIPTVASHITSNKQEAAAAAAELGYPVAIKILSSDITHKSDVGGVRLNLTSRAELEKAYDEMTITVREKVPGAALTGVLVQQYRPGGIEVILGGKQDPEFGPVVVYGLGGIYTELFKDVSFRIAPFTREEALDMIRETRSYRLLQGFRGQSPADIDALLECILRLSQLLTEIPEIKELDINPLLVGANGVLAVDARIMI